MSGRKGRAPEVRTQFNVIKARLAKQGVTSAELVAILKKDHRKIISAESDELIDIGLMKLAVEACDGRTGVETTAQLEMFAEYATPKMVTLHRKDSKGKLQNVHIAVGALTIPQVREYVVESTKKAHSRRDEELKELVRLADDMEQHRESPSSTIDECWERAKG